MTDVERILEAHMGLQRSEYDIAHFLDLERFIVLDAAQALRLAGDLGGVPTSGQSRLARKRYLLRDYGVPVRIRTRTKANVTERGGSPETTSSKPGTVWPRTFEDFPGT